MVAAALAPTAGARAEQPVESETADVIGVVTFNAYRELPERRAWSDARTLVGQDGVDVIGWQEMDRFDRVLERLQPLGFDSVNPPGRAGEDAVSWRSSTFELVTWQSHRMHDGVPGSLYPIPPRFVVEVVLRHRSSGRLLTVLNTHVNHKIEDVRRAGHPLRTVNMRYARRHFALLRDLWSRPATTDWTLGTGDLNVDHAPDRRVRYWGFPAARLADVAVSSWSRLGWRDRRDTFERYGQHRKIDYVFVAAADLAGDATYRSHRVIGGLHSDHRAVLARIELRAPAAPTDAPAP